MKNDNYTRAARHHAAFLAHQTAAFRWSIVVAMDLLAKVGTAAISAQDKATTRAELATEAATEASEKTEGHDPGLEGAMEKETATTAARLGTELYENRFESKPGVMRDSHQLVAEAHQKAANAAVWRI